jgi:hypothetical protein
VTAPAQVGQTAYINPDIHDATGALRCAEGSAIFVIATRRQIERLRATIQRELGNVPVVGHVIRFEARIADAATRCTSLVDEHIRHARTQHELAGDPNLAQAADGYLAARSRGRSVSPCPRAAGQRPPPARPTRSTGTSAARGAPSGPCATPPTRSASARPVR